MATLGYKHLRKTMPLSKALGVATENMKNKGIDFRFIFVYVKAGSERERRRQTSSLGVLLTPDCPGKPKTASTPAVCGPSLGPQ